MIIRPAISRGIGGDSIFPTASSMPRMPEEAAVSLGRNGRVGERYGGIHGARPYKWPFKYMG